MIFLSDKQIISHGKTRKCYVHPDNNKLCIKVMKPLHKNAKFLRKEIIYYKKIQNRNKKYSLTFFASYHGTVETNMGIGYLYSLIKDYDGKISLPLKHYLETKLISEFPNKLSKAALTDLKQKMVKYRVFGYDVYHDNLLCKLKGKHDIELVLVDGLGIHHKPMRFRSHFAFLINHFEFLARARVEKLFIPLSKILSASGK